MKDIIKILQLFDSYPSFYQPYIPPVINALNKQKGVEMKIMAFNGGGGEKEEVAILPNYKVRKVLSKILQLLNRQYRVLNYFEIKALQGKVDIIHIQHSYLFGNVLQLLKLPKGMRPKIVITLRGGDTYIKPWTGKKWKDFYKVYGSMVDAFIVMSKDQKKYLIRWGVPLENIHVIPISFGNKFSIEPKVANKDTLRLVSVFRMCWEKNITDNLRFARLLKEKNIPFAYDVYGDGPDLGQVYYLRDKYNLNEEVNVLGKMANEGLKKNLLTYDFILQLSHSEAFPTSVIEAQAYGIPALVSNNGGLPEMIRNGWNGFIVDLDNFEPSINETLLIWNNDYKYMEMSKNAITQSHQNYTVEHEVDNLVELYGRLIG